MDCCDHLPIHGITCCGQGSKTRSLGHFTTLDKPNRADANLLVFWFIPSFTQTFSESSCFEATLDALRHKIQEWMRVQGGNPNFLGPIPSSTAGQPWALTQMTCPPRWLFFRGGGIISYHLGLLCGLAHSHGVFSTVY